MIQGLFYLNSQLLKLKMKAHNAFSKEVQMLGKADLSEQFYMHKNPILITVRCISLFSVLVAFVKKYVRNSGEMYGAGAEG